jgi:signal transduction histidine kinase
MDFLLNSFEVGPLYLILLFLFAVIAFATSITIYITNRDRKVQQLESKVLGLQQMLYERSLEKSLEEIQEGYRNFLYNISHEVSNPLQSIQTTLDNMKELTAEDAGRWIQYTQIIGSEITRLIRLTENLRLLSSLETYNAPVKREPVNIKGVIDEVIMSKVDVAEERGIKLRYSGPNRPARVLGNRDQLFQVLYNLIDNSIKYGPKEDGEVEINVVDCEKRLCIRVIDNGIGIPAEDLNYVFNTAYQVPGSRRSKIKGTGLGLAIVKRIIEQHEGTIKIESSPGEFTRVEINLPAS